MISTAGSSAVEKLLISFAVINSFAPAISKMPHENVGANGHASSLVPC